MVSLLSNIAFGAGDILLKKTSNLEDAHYTYIVDCSQQEKDHVEILNKGEVRDETFNVRNIRKNCTVEFKNCELPSIPLLFLKRIKMFQNVQRIHVHKSGVKTFDSTDLRDFDDLKELEISYNNLTKLPEYPFSNTSIRAVDLSHNEIVEIDETIFIDVQLSSIDLSFNKISEFNSKIFSKVRLEKIDLSHNRIKVLHSDLFEFASGVKQIDLSHNLIEKFTPKLHYSISMLSVFDLSYNQIESLSLEMNAPYLANLTLKGNCLSKMPNALPTAVTDLDLSLNNIQRLHAHNLKDLLWLQHLHLDNTNLSEIDSGAFSDLKHLRKLNLSNNHLTKMNFDSSSFKNTVELDVFNNNFSCSHLEERFKRNAFDRFEFVKYAPPPANSSDLQVNGIDCVKVDNASGQIKVSAILVTILTTFALTRKASY